VTPLHTCHFNEVDKAKQSILLKIQTLILHGTQDKIFSYELAEQMHKSLANSTLIPFGKSGHALFIEEFQNSMQS